MHSLRLAAYVFGLIFIAELPDKTALAALVLATRHKPLPVFFGSALALTVQSLVAVAAGSALSLLPARPVHIGAGIFFILSGIVMWVRAGGSTSLSAKEEEATSSVSGDTSWKTFATVFGVVFVAEWGDLTQLATAAIAARERAPFIVFGASTLALWAVAGIAVVVGHRASKMFRQDLLQRVAAVLFVVVGVALASGKF